MSETTIVEVQRNGTVTIPKSIRDVLGIKENDFIRIIIEKVERNEK